MHGSGGSAHGLEQACDGPGLPPARLSPLFLLAVFNAIGPLSVDMYLPGWPSIAATFHCPVAAVQLSLSSYFAGFGLGQLFWGPLSDSLGRRPIVLTGSAIYVVACLACLMADQAAELVAWRLVQGFGACAGPVISSASVRDCYARDSGARIYSLIMSITLLVPMVAPSLGGLLLLWLGWRSIFLALAGSGLAVLTLAAVFMRETHEPGRRQALSVAGLLMSGGQVLRERRFLGYALTSALLVSGLFAYLSSVSHLLLEVYHVPAGQFGLYFGFNLIGQCSTAYVNSRVVRRFGSDRVLRWGICLALVTAAGLLLGAILGGDSLAWVAVPLFFFLATLPLVMGNAMACGLAAVPRHAGSAASLIGVAQCGCGAVIGAVLGLCQDGSARPLGVAVLSCAVGAVICYRYLIHKRL